MGEVLGNLNDPSYEIVLRRELGGAFETDELLLDWDEATAPRFCGVTACGRTVELALDGPAAPKRLGDGDVVGIDRTGAVPVAVVVRFKTAEAYLVEVDACDPVALAHACWEIGNMHAPLFRGDSDARTVRLLTPAMPVVDRMLAGLAGVRLTRVHTELDAGARFASKATEVVVGFSPDFNIIRKKR